MREWWFRRLIWLATILASLGVGAACNDESRSTRYDLSGSWFFAAGDPDGSRCFPRGMKTGEFRNNYWLVTQMGGDISAKDGGGCTLTLREEHGEFIGDGESCAIDQTGPLAKLGIAERRYVRLRLDPEKKYFGATFVDRQESGELDRSIVCNLVEARTEAARP